MTRADMDRRRAMCAAYASGLSGKQVGAKFNVHPSTVFAALHAEGQYVREKHVSLSKKSDRARDERDLAILREVEARRKHTSIARRYRVAEGYPASLYADVMADLAESEA